MSGHERQPKEKPEENSGLHLIPDWRDRNTYPRPEDLNDTFWRWEFLRRRPDYRQDWEKSYPPSYAFDRACADDPAYPTRFHKRIFSPDHPAFRARMPDSLEKYHLSGLPNPAIAKPWMLSFDSNYGRMYFGQGPDWLEGGEEIHLRVSEWRVAALFNLKKPLPAQMEKITLDLMKWQEYQMGRNVERRKCRDEWPTYLRVLDAVELGWSFWEIGLVVCEISDAEAAEARASQLYKQACQLSRHFPM